MKTIWGKKQADTNWRYTNDGKKTLDDWQVLKIK